MNAIHYTTQHTKLDQIIDQVCDDHNPVIITRNDKPSVVIISLEDYQSLESTAYLLRSHKKNFPATKLDEVAGCLNYQGKAKTIEEMEQAIAQGIEELWNQNQ